MNSSTNLDHLKTVAIALLHSPIEQDDLIPEFLIHHPFFSDRRQPLSKREAAHYLDVDVSEVSDPFFSVDIVHDANALNIVTKRYESLILESNSVAKILNYIRQPYHLAFLKYGKSYFSKADFDQQFGETWTESENPNLDANVPLEMSIQWFREANPENLMNKEELAYLRQLPETVTVYRGVAIGRSSEGISYTDNKETAIWFAHRFDRDHESGYVLTGTIPRSKILAYFSRRDEFELVVDPDDIDNLHILD